MEDSHFHFFSQGNVTEIFKFLLEVQDKIEQSHIYWSHIFTNQVAEIN